MSDRMEIKEQNYESHVSPAPELGKTLDTILSQKQGLFETYLKEVLACTLNSLNSYTEYFGKESELNVPDVFVRFLAPDSGNSDQGSNLNQAAQLSGQRALFNAMEYSLLSGGKRFRPSLGLLYADCLGLSAEKVLPILASIEMIHTYSLIHDDLPAMDNDSVRRGKPTNHVVYGEALALLAGDTLLTEAFSLIAKAYYNEPKIAMQLVLLLSESSGLRGMAGGQAIDLNIEKDKTDELGILKLHSLKTGALIACACKAVAILSGEDQQVLTQAKSIGESIGLAFQLRDDILDFNPDKPEVPNMARILGVAKTTDLLKLYTEKALKAIEPFAEKAEGLRDLILFNHNRST